MDNKFYLYVHVRLDTKCVFYVGKGHGRRAWTKYGRNQHWRYIVAKHGYEVEILARDLSEERAFLMEQQLISQLGRRDLGMGALCNYTDGGEGPSNPSKETRAKISAASKALIHTELSRNKISEASKGKKKPPFSAAHRMKISAAKTGLALTIESKAKISEALKGKKKPPRSQEYREKISKATKGRVASAESKAKMSAAAKGRKKPLRSPEHCAKLSEIAQARAARRRQLKAEALLASTEHA